MATADAAKSYSNCVKQNTQLWEDVINKSIVSWRWIYGDLAKSSRMRYRLV